MCEDMLTDRGFGGIGPRGCLLNRLAPMNTGREHLVLQPLLVAPGSIGTVCPDLGTGIDRPWLLPFLQTVYGLAQKTSGSFGIPGGER